MAEIYKNPGIEINFVYPQAKWMSYSEVNNFINQANIIKHVECHIVENSLTGKILNSHKLMTSFYCILTRNCNYFTKMNIN